MPETFSIDWYSWRTFPVQLVSSGESTSSIRPSRSLLKKKSAGSKQAIPIASGISEQRDNPQRFRCKRICIRYH